MKIVVAVKQVAALDEDFEIRADEKDVDEDFLLYDLNEWDDFSLEEAMKIELDQAQAQVASLKNLSPMEKAVYFNRTSPERIAFIGTHVANGTVDENETREIAQ